MAMPILALAAIGVVWKI